VLVPPLLLVRSLCRNSQILLSSKLVGELIFAILRRSDIFVVVTPPPHAYFTVVLIKTLTVRIARLDIPGAFASSSSKLLDFFSLSIILSCHIWLSIHILYIVLKCKDNKL